MSDNQTTPMRNMAIGKQPQGHIDPEEVTENDVLCGCPPACTQSWLQRLATPKVFTAHMMIMTSFLMMSFVYLGAVLTTIERNFQLDSSESGSLTIAADILGVVFVLPLSHYGQRGHRPRWIAGGMMFTALGTFFCAMPHFLSEPVDPQALLTGSSRSSSYHLCEEESGLSSSEDESSPASNSSEFSLGGDNSGPKSGSLRSVWWIVLGQVIVGVGNAPFFPLITTYIDDCVEKHNLTAYTAVLFIAFTIGPSCGFLFGALTTSMYVDFERIPSEMIPDLDQNDPRWIGAWWLGFVILSLLILVLAFPIFFYPRTMPAAVKKWKKDRDKNMDKETRDQEAGGDDHESVEYAKERRVAIPVPVRISTIKNAVKDPLSSLKRLLTNVTNMCLAMYGTAFMSTIAIFGAFGVKYLQTQFSVSPSQAAIMTAIVLGPSNILAQLFSAFICRRFKLNSKQCAMFAVVGTALVVILFSLGFFLGCDNVPVAGVTTSYTELNVSSDRNKRIRCNAGCSCTDDVFQPVCGSNGLTYISPCHAGCIGIDSFEDGSNLTIVPRNPFQRHNYSLCQCVTNKTSISGQDTVLPASLGMFVAVSGQCPTSCSAYVSLSMLLMVAFFLQSSIQNPGMYVALRCVREEDRSMAIGLRSFLGKILGFFPAPVYFGAIINSLCLHWQRTEGNRGSCWIYDNTSFRIAYFTTDVILEGIGLVFLVIMYFSIKEPLVNVKTAHPQCYTKIMEREPNENEMRDETMAPQTHHDGSP